MRSLIKGGFIGSGSGVNGVKEVKEVKGVISVTDRLQDMLFGPYGADSLKHAGSLKKYGVNAVWFHGFDENAFSICDAHDLAPCVEFKTFRADFDKYPELVPIGVDGKPIRYGSLVQGVCLSNKAYLDKTESELSKGLKQFHPKGIWLDYLTYAGWFETPDPDLQESCFCKSCMEDFCETSGVDMDDPVKVIQQFPAQWEKHKCDKIAAYALRYATLIHSVLPDCIVGAYMCPWRPEEHEGALGRIFAQDYQKMSAAIDVFTPLIYAAKSGRSPAWGREFLEGSKDFIPTDKKVQLILDFLDFPQSLEGTALSGQPSWGIQIYAGSKIFDNPTHARVFGEAVKKIKQAAEGFQQTP